jgi:hypothetical protein
MMKPIHPAATLMPELSPDEYAGLVASIREHGLLEPIAVYAGPGQGRRRGRPAPEHLGKVLDGVSRQRACQEAGVEPRYVDVFTTDPVGYVLARNIHRRHLSRKQRRKLIATILQHDPNRSDRQIAQDVGSGHRLVGAVRQELEANRIINPVAARVGADGRTRARPAPIAEDAEPQTTNTGDIWRGYSGLPLIETSDNAIIPEVEIDEAFHNILSPDELAAYEEFSDNVKRQVTAVRLSPVERATIQAMRVRKLLGCAPSTTEVERLRAACSALERELAELKAKNAALKADLAAVTREVRP